MFDQQGQIAGVVKMGVRENDGSDAARVDGKRCPIAQTQGLEALEQATVDEDALICILDQELGSRDGTCCT